MSKTRKAPVTKAATSKNAVRVVPLPWHEFARKIVASCRMTLFVGEPGGGKTEAAQQMLTQFNGIEPVVLNGTPETERQDMLGTFLLVGGESQYANFSLTRALKEGRSLLVNDMGQIPVETLVTLLPLRDGRATYSHPVTSEEIPVPDDFRIIATANPESLQMTCRRAPESAKAILEGFAILEIPAPTEEQLRSIVEAHLPDAEPALIDAGLKHWETFRRIKQSGSEGGISVRAVLEYAQLRIGGLDESTATRVAFVNKFIYDEDLHSSANLSWSMGGSSDDSAHED